MNLKIFTAKPSHKGLGIKMVLSFSSEIKGGCDIMDDTSKGHERQEQVSPGMWTYCYLMHGRQDAKRNGCFGKQFGALSFPIS